MHRDLDRESASPLYEQLAAIIREDIASGRITRRVPSEWDLAESYDVARDTVRQAIRLLRDEGTVEVRSGKGTFVRHPE